MKPSIDEVLQKLAEMNRHKKYTHNWIYIEHLAEALDTHYDNILPSLLMLEREDLLQFNSRKRVAVTLLRRVMAA
ncbi:MAG TPA: hypothetical protein VIN07_01625 [Flavipsychrobacter sp.]